MGRIHDALVRAERERAKLEGEGTEPTRDAPAREAPGEPPLTVPAPGGAPARDSAPAPDAVRVPEPPAPRATAESIAPAAPAPASAVRPQAERTSRLVATDLDPAISDQYRSLRARLQSLRRKGQTLRSIVLTSAQSGEGKTTTAIHLAQTFGLEKEFDSCLVDLDLRNPDIWRSLATPSDVGVAEILMGQATLDEALVHVPGTRLSVLASATTPAQPSELIGSMPMVRLIEDLHKRFEMVILDAPPVLGLPDGTQIVDLCDSALLVVCAEVTTRTQLLSVLERIDRSKVIGTVFNQCEIGAGQYSYGYYTKE